ncbi:hypothetical protein [uncultured Campylobacter sp.]|uniref:hypothetical protein n=1 Tax=uncultured Campylobacter sp. TaxID=218934 RepID=UPI00261F9FCF|nr:hypothetical protein [uncultured Campylobacter sp.]
MALNLAFSRCGSRCVKFTNLTQKSFVASKANKQERGRDKIHNYNRANLVRHAHHHA